MNSLLTFRGGGRLCPSAPAGPSGDFARFEPDAIDGLLAFEFLHESAELTLVATVLTDWREPLL
jgi:hypothetical protein